jgi:hypothetical protein
VQKNIKHTNSKSRRSEISRVAATARWEAHKRNHPLQLLLKALPEPGIEFDSNQRASWLTLANSAFDVLYKQKKGDVQIQIIIKK